MVVVVMGNKRNVIVTIIASPHSLRFHDSAGMVRRFGDSDDWHWDEQDGGFINRCLKHDSRSVEGDISWSNTCMRAATNLAIVGCTRACRGAMSIVLDAVKVAPSGPSLAAATAALVDAPRSLSAISQWRAAYLADPPARHNSALTVQVS